MNTGALMMLAAASAAVLAAAESARPLSDTAVSTAGGAAGTQVRPAPIQTRTDSSADETTTITVARDSAGVTVVRRDGDGCATAVRTEDRDRPGDIGARLGEWRRKGWGGSGAPTPGVYAIGIRPVKDLISRVSPLRGRTFNLHAYNYEPFYMSGGMGYAGLGNGMRLGGLAMNGDRRFVSEPFGGDSVVALDLHVQFGGLLLEKALVNGRWNAIAGGALGSGSITAKAETIDRGQYSAFDRDTSERSDGGLKATFVYLQAHGGATYTVAPWFHVGASVNLPLFVSPEGFGSRTPDFVTVNPGLHLRIVFGNLG